MRVVIVSKEPFNTITYRNVTNIAYSNGEYTLTYTNNGLLSTISYSAEDYIVQIM